MKISHAVAVDVLAILTFATVGRSSHAATTDALGVADTAWPFLVACAVGGLWAGARREPAALSTGVVVWACTLVGGMLLRLATGDTAQPPFVIVAAISLALLLLGWRAGFALIERARRHDGATSRPHTLV